MMDYDEQYSFFNRQHQIISVILREFTQESCSLESKGTDVSDGPLRKAQRAVSGPRGNWMLSLT